MAGGGLQLFLQLLAGLFHVDVFQQLLDGLGAHAGLEIVLVFLLQVPVLFLREGLHFRQLAHAAGIGDDIHGEVQNPLQHPGREVQDQAHAGGNPLEVPNVGHGGRQFNVAHALPAHLATGDLHAAAVTDLALVADALILAAMALPILNGPKDALAEQAVPLGLQSAVVNGLGLFYLAMGPFADLVGRSKSDLD